MNPQLIHLTIITGITLILTFGYNILLGGVGIANLGHIGTMAVGAYTSALLVLRFGWSPLLAMATGVAAGVVLGLALAFLVRRLRGDYLGLVALNLYFLIIVFALNLHDLTRGALGLPGISRPDGYTTPAGYLVLTLGLTALAYLAMTYLFRSRFGRVMAAVRDDEVAASVLGKDTGRVKVIAFVVSSAYAALSGALLAHYIQYIDPLTFNLPFLALTIAATVVGGMGSSLGAVVGTLIVVWVPEALRFFTFSPDTVGALRQMLFSMVILLVLIYRPRGLFGKFDLDATE